jgi:serine/threonine-protein kinase RsbW
MLSVARAFVDAACQSCALDKHTTHALILASSEAVSNVIRHAHEGRLETILQLQFRLWPEFVELLVYDQGNPFDIRAVPHLDPAELRLGGRGVFLMRALMDELDCLPRDGKGNILRMIKRLGGPAAPDAPPAAKSPKP